MGAVESAVAIYVIVYFGVMMLLCAIGHFKNYAGKKEDDTSKDNGSQE